MSPADILRSVDILSPGDKIMIKENSEIVTVNFVIIYSEGIKVRIIEDGNTYYEKEFIKVSNSDNTNRSFFIKKK